MKRRTYFFVVLLHGMMLNFLHADSINESHKTDISICLASLDNLKSIIKLDVSISDEYFKPLLLQYPEFEGKDEEVEKLLSDEVETDIVWFTSCIVMENQQRLYAAYDRETPIGFVACHKHDDTIFVIDLLMIDAKYRGQGIGKQLIQACIQAFSEVATCMLVVLDKNEQARTAYEKMGFVLMNEKPEFIREKYSEPRYICYYLTCNTQVRHEI